MIILRWFWNNKGAFLLSFVLSITVWVAAVTAEDPTIENTIQEPIAITYLPPADGLQMVGAPPLEAFVTIRAPESVWGDISPDTVKIEVDLADMEPGFYKITLAVFSDLDPYHVKSIDPPTVLVKIEALLSKELAIDVRLRGDTAFGFDADNPIVSPEKATIVGPSTSVVDIIGLRVEVNLAGESQDIDQEFEVIAYDEDQQQVEGVEITPQFANVFIGIVQGEQYKIVSIIPKTVGSPAYGYRMVGITPLPNQVLVTSSDPGAFEGLPGFIETVPVDINGATETVEQNVSLVLPEGISPVLEQTVLVIVTIAPIETSITFDLPIETQGLGLGLAAELSPETINVKLTGPLAFLEPLQPEDVRVVLNLVDLGLGSYEITPEIIVALTEIEVEIFPAQIEVEIVLAPPPTPTPSS